MSGMDGCKLSPGAATISVILYFYLDREILFLSGKSQGILKSDVWQPCVML